MLSQRDDDDMVYQVQFARRTLKYAAKVYRLREKVLAVVFLGKHLVLNFCH